MFWSAPNLLRVGSFENVFVEAQDYTGGNLNVRITVKNHPKKNLEILSKSVALTVDNKFQILTDIKNFFTDDPLEKQYVYLQAQFPSVTLEKVVMVSFQSGYLFVQTDKPIYTPASTVLPSFEVTISPRKPFFYVNERSLIVPVCNKVSGTAFVVFGVMDNDKKISIAASLQKAKISEGEGEAELKREMIKENFPDIQQLVGKSLYISVSVLTESGSEMGEAHKKGIQIVTSPYTIHFKRTPQYFKPGMPFDVSVYVTNPDETPAKNVEVEVSPGGVNGRTKANGIAKVTVNTPGKTSTLDITAKTKDPQLTAEQQAVKKMGSSGLRS
ncbi:hypothetical protein QQF64_000013 [Cirrhinus molitorella]|uniref:Uncharacterized protein n=1 Tax=Cirrhinus molitorella TaxID=172907 RepID=A0ABR3NWF7_9TELE